MAASHPQKDTHLRPNRRQTELGLGSSAEQRLHGLLPTHSEGDQDSRCWRLTASSGACRSLSPLWSKRRDLSGSPPLRRWHCSGAYFAGARQQDRRADYRLRGHRPPGTAADVGQAAERLPGDGVPRRGATGIWRNQRYMCFNNGFILISWREPSGIRRQHFRRLLCAKFLRQIKPSGRQYLSMIAPGDHHVRTYQRSSVTTLG
jgi:hypothetical protein